MKKKCKHLLSVLICLSIGLMLNKIDVSAETTIKEGKKIVLLGAEYEEIYTFTYDGESVLYFYCESSMRYKEDRGKGDEDDLFIELGLTEGLDTIISTYSGENRYAYLYAGKGEKGLEKGKKYSIYISNYSEEYDYSVKYKIIKYNGYSTDFSIQSNMDIKTDSYKQIKVNSVTPYGSFPDIQWASSNKKIATVDKKGYVLAKKPGKCRITARMDNGQMHYCTVSVTNPPPELNYTYIELYRGEAFTIKLLYTSKKITWKSSNKKVATISSKGRIKGKEPGTCIITAKCGGKTYRAKIHTLYRNPNFYSELIEYRTRSNTFVVRIKNYSNKSLTIYSKNAKSKDDDYKTYDRTLKLSDGKARITIKGHQSKKVKFKIIGRYTWPNVKSHNIYFDFKFDGKKYKAWVDYGDCGGYKKGKKWIYTQQGWDE